MQENREMSKKYVRKVGIILGNGFPLAAKKINRNTPFECGSGKKAKKCCGDKTKYAYSKLNETQIEERDGIKKQN